MSLLLLFNSQLTSSTGNDPRKIVLIGFDSAPGVDPPTWTDVSAYVMEGSVNRGRLRELDSYQAGVATITLRNEDRRFDPSYSAGPYFGKLLPMKRIRIAAEYNGIVYSVFDGFVDSWDQKYWDAADSFSTAVVSATDAFKPLEAGDLESSVYVAEVLTDSPVAFWRLNEADGTATCADSSGNGYHLNVTGVPDFGQSSLVSREAGTGVLMSESVGQDIGKQFAGNLPLTGPPCTLEIVYRRTVDGSDGGLVGQVCTVLTQGAFILATSSTLVVAQAVNGANSQQLALSTGVDLDDNLTHHIVARWDATGDVKIFVDGVDRTSGTTTCANVPFASSSGYLGAAAMPEVLFTDPGTGIHQFSAIYNTALSSTRIAAHAAAVTTPWNGDTPAQRMTRILDQISWPATLRDLDTGSSVLQSADIGGQSVLEHAKKVEQSEFGNLYITADGKVRLEGRNAAVNQPSNITLDDTTTSSSYATIEFDFSDQLVRNDVTISRNEGAAQRVKDVTSIASFLKHSYVRDGLIHNSDTVSRSAAELLVSEYKDPLLRVAGLTLVPRGSPATLFPQVLGRELTDRVTVNRKPQGVGTAISKACQIEAISHEFGPKRWITSWSLSPAFASGGGSFWQIGTAGFSELGTTNRLYF